MATVYNLPNQYNGDTFEILTLKFFTTSAESGNEINLSTATPKMTIRKNAKDGTLAETLTIGSGLEWVTDGSDGQVRTTEFLIDWGAGNYFYDFQVTYTATNVQTYLQGNFQVIEDVTD